MSVSKTRKEFEVIRITAEPNEFPNGLSWISDYQVTPNSIVLLSSAEFDNKIDHELIDFFSNQPRVGAAEISSSSSARICTTLAGRTTAFLGSIILDYYRWWTQDQHSPLTRQDFGNLLNRLGFSQYELPLLNSNAASENQSDYLSPVDRPWHGYIKHVSNDWEEFSLDYLANANENSILLDARTLDPINNGTARVSVGFLRNLANYLKVFEVTEKPVLLATAETVSFFKLENLGFEIKETLENDKSTFDIGISVSPVKTVLQGAEVLYKSNYWSVIHLDLIAARSLELLSQNVELLSTISFYFEYASRIYFISNDALEDATKLFPHLGDEIREKSFIEYLGEDLASNSQSSTFALKDEDYVLILGNHYPHKQVLRAASELVDLGLSTVTIGREASIHPLHKVLDPGTVSDQEMSQLISNSLVTIFPSIYEGFGLPILEIASSGKAMILWDTDVSREVSSLIKDTTDIFFVSSMSELGLKVLEVVQNPSDIHKITTQRSMKDFSFNLCNDIFEATNRADSGISNKSRRLASYILRVASSTKTVTSEQISQLHWKRRLQKKLQSLIR